MVDWGVLVSSALVGQFHPVPRLYYSSLWRTFLAIIVPLMTICFFCYKFSERFGDRIQGQRRSNPPVFREALATSRAMWVVATMSAWPIGMYRAGIPTGFTWTLEEMGLTWWMVALQMYFGIIVIDALQYWKHRLLHTKLFYPFHKHHHSYRDPTPFAGFAVGPIETVLTFWPLLTLCFPKAKHFIPIYVSAVVGFVLLNFYLHCGVTFSALEMLLPRIGLNSSAWHTYHHSDVIVNFGEVSYIWDNICKTSRAHAQQRKQAAAIANTLTKKE